MAEPSGLKLGGLVEGICLNILTKKFFRSVNGRGKMAVKRQVPIAEGQKTLALVTIAYRLGDG